MSPRQKETNPGENVTDAAEEKERQIPLIAEYQMNASIDWWNLLLGAVTVVKLRGRGTMTLTTTCPTVVSGRLHRLEKVRKEREDTLEAVA